MKKKLSKKEKMKIKKLKTERRLQKKLEKQKNGKKFDLSTVFGGMAVGIANIIPGVSGGTMLVIFNLFDKLMYAIGDIFKKKTDTRKESIILIFKVLIGAAIGIVGFAKVLGITLKYLEAETIFWFMGLILFSVPIIIKEEMKGQKFNIVAFLIGFIFIIGLQYLQMKNPTNNVDDATSVFHFVSLVIYGIIGGATMIFPGVSGSMVLLVLGKYEMIRNYVDKVTTFDIDILTNLFFFGIGVILGIVLSAKLTSFLLKKYKGTTVSIILGFIIASALILPFNIEKEIVFETKTICSILASFTLGGIVIYYINRLQENQKKALD